MAGYFYIKLIEGIKSEKYAFPAHTFRTFQDRVFFLLQSHSSTASIQKGISTLAVLIKPLWEIPKDSLLCQLYIQLHYTDKFTLTDTTTKNSTTIHLSGQQLRVPTGISDKWSLSGVCIWMSFI